MVNYIVLWVSDSNSIDRLSNPATLIDKPLMSMHFLFMNSYEVMEVAVISFVFFFGGGGKGCNMKIK